MEDPTAGEYVVLSIVSMFLTYIIYIFQMECQNSRPGVLDFWNFRPRILYFWNFHEFPAGNCLYIFLEFSAWNFELPAGLLFFFSNFQWGILKYRGFIGFSMGFTFLGSTKAVLNPYLSHTKPMFWKSRGEKRKFLRTQN